jgi:O-succinylbenzoate synthase
MRATYKKYTLNFKRPSGTSRGVMTEKETWFIKIEQDGKLGIGECGILRGLSIDDRPDYQDKLKWVCDNIHLGEDKLWEEMIGFPSIQFGLETAFLSLKSDNPYILFPSEFTNGSANIPINGLVWMGSEGYMKEQIEDKIEQGFSCIKLKIGAIDFNQELSLLQFIRNNFTSEQIEIRVDANGAFSDGAALNKLIQLSIYQLHSIEQPIEAGQLKAMSQLCASTPLPIALDEELIGIFTYEDKEALLVKIQPQFIILKPSLVGGFIGCTEWIALAEKHEIGWWVTSALESNIGLNAIAQWTFTKNSSMPQGLGTGSLYTNNFNCPLEVKNGQLCYNPQAIWEVSL